MTQNQPDLFGASKKPRTIVYIDGFNLYNGSIKGTAHKWLDLEKYFDQLRPNDDILQVNYFTARMKGDSGVRQEVYLRALDTLSRVRIVVGNYKRTQTRCRVRGCKFSGDRRFPKWEEKRTDVSIAVQMVADALKDEADTQVVVSGDSDLVPPLHMIKSERPNMKLVVYVPARDPQRGAAVEIRSAADKDSTLPMALLRHCHLPAELPDGSGGVIRKPSVW